MKKNKKTKKCSKSVPRGVGNSKTPSKAPKLHWFLTWNNYSVENVERLIMFCNEFCSSYDFSEEVGETGTPHLQGQITLKRKRRFTFMQKFDKNCWWEPTKSVYHAIDYTQKEGGKRYTNVSNTVFFFDEFLKIEWYEWQKKVIEIVTGIPDDRTVNWFWERKGGVGKSKLTKYLVLRFNALIVDGKKGDVFHQIAKRREEDINIDIVIVDIPRSAFNNLSYQALECIKNGLISSGKYERGQYAFKSPHVVVLANSPPDEDMLSADRWNIIEIS